jgi:hypothetical protein
LMAAGEPARRRVFRSAKYFEAPSMEWTKTSLAAPIFPTAPQPLPATTTYQRRRTGKRLGAGERWHKPFNGYPADDRLRSPHPVTRTHPTEVGGPGASGLSLADALRRGPRRRLRRPYCNLALCKLASEITGLNVKSPTGSERTAPRRRLLLLLRGYLALRRSLFLRGGLRLCLLHHTALLAKSSGGVASAPTRIVGTASRLLQRNKKNIFHIKEACMERPRARRRRDACRLARRCCCMRPRRRLYQASNISKITETPVKWSLLRRANRDPQSHARPLDSIRGGTSIVQNRRSEHRIGRQKKVAQIFPEASLWRSRERESSESASTDSQNRLPMSLRKPLDKASDIAIAASIHASRGSERSKFCSSDASLECSATSRATVPCVQMPSFALRRSFTVCGFALPLDAFITWPMNHPIALGFAFACSA